MAGRGGVDGLAALRRKLEQLGEQIHQAAIEAVTEAAESVRDDVQMNVRVDSGELRDGVIVRVDEATLTAEVGWIDPRLYYARYQEHGTSKISANPVLTAAAEQERRIFPSRIERALETGQ